MTSFGQNWATIYFKLCSQYYKKNFGGNIQNLDLPKSKTANKQFFKHKKSTFCSFNTIHLMHQNKQFFNLLLFRIIDFLQKVFYNIDHTGHTECEKLVIGRRYFAHVNKSKSVKF